MKRFSLLFFSLILINSFLFSQDLMIKQNGDDINGYNGAVQTQVYDLSGRLLKSTNNTTISLKDYAKGIYVFRVSYGDIVEELKVVKD